MQLIIIQKMLSFGHKILAQAGGWDGWKDILEIDENKLNILGIGIDADKLKGFIKTLILIGISGLAVGLIAVIAYGGYVWITAGDKEDRLQKSHKIIKSGFVAIAIAFGFLVLLGILAGFLGVNITDFSFLDMLFE